MAISLNIPQERELARLIDYERSTCSVEGERVRREKRDARLIGLSALFAALCVVAGFLLGRFLA